MAVTPIKKDTAKSKDAEPASDAKAQPKKGKKKWVLLLVGILCLGGIGGGAFWYMTRDGKGQEAKSQPAKPPIFVPLDMFTVNLQLEEVQQFLQIGLSLKVADNTVADALKLHMPEIRDSILLLLSSRKASELLTLAGKRTLSTDIVNAVNGILTPNGAPKAAAAAPKPEAAPAASQQADAAQAPAETPVSEAPASDNASADAPPADKPAPAAALAPPVRSVLFTSFIIQ